MKYQPLGRSGIFTTDLALGAMTFGDPRAKGTPAREAEKIIQAYLDAGGNHIDTANVYNAGKSEEIVGRALRKKRDGVIVATKVNFPIVEGVNERGLSRYNILKSVEGSLQRLGMEYVDLLYMHCQDALTPVEESLRAFDDLVTQGKVRYIGASNFVTWRLMKALAAGDARGWSRFVAAQYQYSLVQRDIEYELLELFREEGLGLMPWGPLGGGFLTGKYQRGKRPAGDYSEGRIGGMAEHTEEAWQRRNTGRNWNTLEVLERIVNNRQATYSQIALTWLRQQPGVSSVIMGVRTMEQLEDNLRSADMELTGEELMELDMASTPPERYPYRFLKEYGRKAPE